MLSSLGLRARENLTARHRGAAASPASARGRILSAREVRVSDGDQSWFDAARFGMFVHWGHASVHGVELSWPLVGGTFALPECTSMPVDEYHAGAARFDPQRWDAR